MVFYQNKFYTSHDDSKIRDWNINANDADVGVFLSHSSGLITAFDVDKDVLASADSDGRMIFWNLASRRSFRLFNQVDSPVNRLKLKNAIYVTGHDNGTANLYSVSGNSPPPHFSVGVCGDPPDFCVNLVRLLWVCMYVCMYVPYLLPNCWTDSNEQ